MTDHTNTYPDLVSVEDWLNAKGYTGEAGACHQAMSLIRSQEKRIEDLRKEVRIMDSEYKTATARISEEEEKGREREEYIALCQIRIEELKAALAPFVNAAHFKITASTGTVIENTVWNICVSEADLLAARAAYLGEKE
jgi:hypothetical protein